LPYAASGQVEGNVLNQFSLDEHKGYLRVATSFGKVPDEGVHSALSVLEQSGADQALTGKVDEIAPHEDIRSVRFDGDRGFIVTFKKTDPLYWGAPLQLSICGVFADSLRLLAWREYGGLWPQDE